MILTALVFRRFKQFDSKDIALRDLPFTLVAGPNNAGKSTILQGLAVWEYCKTAIQREKGQRALTNQASKTTQGLGLNDDEFSPINLPSLKHLWTNLKTSKVKEVDGYTLFVGLKWLDSGVEYHLVFALALVNDRLFIKVAQTNLPEGVKIPCAAYLPPFAGISAKEQRQPIAIRRRRIGEGLAVNSHKVVHRD